MDILKNVKGFIDPEYLPDYETLDADPSHLSLAKVKKLLRYWFNRQKSEEIAFRFHYVLEGSERVLGSDPKRITGKTLSKKVPKGRGQPQKTRVMSDITGDEAELLMGVGTVGKKKTSGKRLKKGKAHSKEIISDSGEEFDFAGVDDVSFSDDPPNPIPEVSGSTGINTATSDSCTPIWRKAPANLASSEIDLWNAFVEKLPDSCSNWSKTQAMVQFEVFKGWSNNYLSPGRNHSPNTPVEARDIRDVGSHSERQRHSPDIAATMRDIRPNDAGDPSDSSHAASISKAGSGIPNGKTEDILMPQPHGSNTNENFEDVSKLLEPDDVPKDRNSAGNLGKLSERGKEAEIKDLSVGITKPPVLETPDALRTLKDRELGQAPDGTTKAGGKKEQPRTSKGNFTKSIAKHSEEEHSGKKRLREDPAESSAAAKVPSPKKLKINETPQKPGRRGRSNKNGKEPNAAVLQRSTEPGPSVALTRSKAKIRNTRK